MEAAQLKRLIDVASGRTPADTVIKNCKVIDVYNCAIIEGDIAVCDGLIAGIGCYNGDNVIDAHGLYAAPGFIDGHFHVESSYLCPEELGRLIVPHGTTTIIADPHEIANVCGFNGIKYMIEAAKLTALDVKMMMPSCVPATPFEHSGARIDAQDMETMMAGEDILGLGEFMNFPGVINGDGYVLDKLLEAKKYNKPIDGHSPFIAGHDLNAYASTGIHTDHECSTAEEMRDRIARGMYVLLRQGSACHNLAALLTGLTPANSRRCVLCSDDCQPKTILGEGHLDNDLRLCVSAGVDPFVAIQMTTLNAAECFGLTDRGAIAPGLRADIVLFEDMAAFNVKKVLTQGVETASDGKYLPPVTRYDISSTKGSFHVKDFSMDKLKLIVRSGKAHAISIIPGGIVTGKEIVTVKTDVQGQFIYEPGTDIVKLAVIERHQNTGNVAVGLIKGYGIKKGAIALSVAHDSHNIIVTGVNDEDMAVAVEELIKQGGGFMIVKDGEIIESMPMPIAGLMSDQSGEWVDEKLARIHRLLIDTLGVSPELDPIMTLSFMALPVIPELKLTDMGLFDVMKNEFITIEA